ncbi:MAG TPA: hypothetical protein VN628_03635, partial [Vicinamibacterales bacterium]|nr:hypothetical protein [Vicinamibacterales bacterium]
MAFVMAPVAIALLIVVRPSIFRHGFGWLDAALLIYVALMALQLIALSPSLRLSLSPALRNVDLRLRLDAPVDAMADGAHPLTVNAAATLQAVWLAVALVLTFWCARALFARGGIRAGARTIATLGLMLSAFGIAQHVTAPR